MRSRARCLFIRALHVYAHQSSMMLNVECATAQVAMYLSDIRTGAAPLGNGRVLHYANSGINVVSQVWNAAIASGLSANSISTAQAAITANTAVYGAALRSISTDARIVARGPADFLIVGIPALELVPTFPFQVPATWDDTRKRQAIAFVGQLASQWNNEMRTFTAALKTQVAGKGGRVFYYDLAQLVSGGRAGVAVLLRSLFSAHHD